MSLVEMEHPDDPRVVLVEVAEHLHEIDRRLVAHPEALSTAWRQMRRCDDAVIDALPPADRTSYEAVMVSSGPRSRRPSAWFRSSGTNEDVARLHLALHRRIVLLRQLAR